MEAEALKKSLSSQSNYINTKKYYDAVQQGDINTIKLCCDVAVNIFQDQQGPHQPKFWCLKFVNDLQRLQEYEWIETTQKNILPILEQIAQFSKESQDDDRGKNLFITHSSSRKKYEQIKELEQIGDSFFRYTLESIWVWSKWFPLDTVVGKLSLYKIAQERLSLMKVKFPTLSYFDKVDVINHIQIQRPPIELFIECRSKLKENIRENSYMELRIFQSSLDKTYFSEKKNNLNNTKTYSSQWKYAVQLMGEGKLGLEVQTKIRSAKMSQMQKKFLQTSVTMKKSRMALQQQVISFTSVLNEKEKLLSDINRHIQEKDQLNQQLISKEKVIQDLYQQNENLRLQIIQMKSESNKFEQIQQVDVNSQFQQLQSTKDMERLLQKREIEIKRQQDQIQHFKGVIESLYSNQDNMEIMIASLQKDQDKKDKELMQYKCQIEEQSNKIALLQLQNKRQIEIIEDLRSQSKESYKKYLEDSQVQFEKISQIDQDKQKYADELQSVKDQNYKLDLEISRFKKEAELLKQSLEGFTKNNNTQQNFYQTLKDGNEYISVSQNITKSQLQQQQNQSKTMNQGFKQKKSEY